MRPWISRRRRRRTQAYGITTADGSHLHEIARRQKQYAATMLFRVVAIVVVVTVPGLSVLERVILGLVATVIPYVAVIRANGVPERDPDPTNLMIGGPRERELPGPERGLAAGDAGQDRDVDAQGAEDDDVTERQEHRE